MNQIVKGFGLFLLCLTIACSDEKGDANGEENERLPDKAYYLSQESESIDLAFEESDVLKHYKAVKGILRAVGSNEKDKPAFLNTKLYEKAAKYAFRIAKKDYPSRNELMDDLPVLLELKAIYDTRPEDAYKLKEDKYEPILSSAQSLIGGDLPTKGWSASYEHLLLALVNKWADTPDELMLYELDKVSLSDIEDNEIRVLAGVLKGVTYLDANLPYKSEIAVTEAINSFADINQLSGTFSGSWIMSRSSDKPDANRTSERLNGLMYLVRGLARMNMNSGDDQKLGTKDLTQFLEASVGSNGLSEWSLLSEAVLMMTKKDLKQADHALNAYMDHDGLTFSERSRLKSITEKETSKEGIGVRELIITGIVAEKLYHFVKNTDFFESVQDNEWGSALLNGEDRFKEFMNKVQVGAGLLDLLN